MIAFVLWLMPFLSVIGKSQTYNETYVVNTTVNITNSNPQVYDVVLPADINLVAYGLQQVMCNLSTYDFNNDTLVVNATLFQANETIEGPIDQNFRYINYSCTPLTVQDFSMNWSCVFDVQYFANNGTYYCNATAIDPKNASSNNQSGASYINSLVAIKLEPVLDYGQLEVGQISNDTQANITNAGNRHANISVKGWGAAEGDGLSFDCDYGSIPVGDEKYSIVSETAYSSMTSLSDVSVNITGFTVPQRIDESLESINSTYWKVYIPVGAGGLCTGKILFTASDTG
jgi:hypothetical protein